MGIQSTVFAMLYTSTWNCEDKKMFSTFKNMNDNSVSSEQSA
jgi:hypothetical protein